MTARRVAVQRLGARRVWSESGRPEDDQALQADVAAGLDAGSSRMSQYLAVRTRYFDTVVVEAIAAGIAQVVVAGAGYDGRSLRYGRKGVRYFELDHPATQADKRRRLERLGIDVGDIGFGAVDFRTGDVALVLQALGHREERPSLFCCEGVSPYLAELVLAGLLRGLARAAGPGSLLAIEVPLEATTPEAAERRARLGVAVKAMGEPLVTAIGRTELTAFLASAGWEVTRAASPAGEDIADSDSSVAFVTAVPRAGHEFAEEA